jgi:hypothetical protein
VPIYSTEFLQPALRGTPPSLKRVQGREVGIINEVGSEIVRQIGTTAVELFVQKDVVYFNASPYKRNALMGQEPYE